MSLYRNKYKYQLIHPVVGTRAYQTTSLKKGARKCYEELKSLNNINTSQFTILNIDTYKIYKFQIDATNINKTQYGGNSKDKGDIIKKIDLIEDAVNKLNSRVQKLENDGINNINNNDDYNVNNINKNNNKNNNDIDNNISIINNNDNNRQSFDLQEKSKDDIIAEAVSKNIYYNNIKKKLDTNELLNQNFQIPDIKIHKNFDENIDSSYCVIM